MVRRRWHPIACTQYRYCKESSIIFISYIVYNYINFLYVVLLYIFSSLLSRFQLIPDYILFTFLNEISLKKKPCWMPLKNGICEALIDFKYEMTFGGGVTVPSPQHYEALRPTRLALPNNPVNNSSRLCCFFRHVATFSFIRTQPSSISTQSSKVHSLVPAVLFFPDCCVANPAWTCFWDIVSVTTRVSQATAT